MNETSPILQASTRYLHPLLLLASVYLLLSGHNAPGGGFVGGLTAAASFSLLVIAHDVRFARRILGVDPRHLIGGGLLAALVAGCLPLWKGLPFLTGVWSAFTLPDGSKLHVGSPMLFDIGVYAVVLGVSVLLVFSFAEERGE